MLLSLIFLLLNFSSIFTKGCLSISSSDFCLTCLSTHYENNYLTNLKLGTSTKTILSESSCILKETDKKIRIIYVLNSECSDCSGADAIYNSLPKALEEESKFAIKFHKKIINNLNP